MDALIGDLGLNELELQRRHGLIGLTRTELDLLQKCITLIPPVKELVPNIISELTMLSSTSSTLTDPYESLENSTYCYLDNLFLSTANTAYLALELCNTLDKLEISIGDFLLSMHRFHIELSQALKSSLEENGLDAAPILCTYQKNVILCNQIMTEIACKIRLRKMDDTIQTLNFKDKLTNTYNRNAFIEELDRSIAITDREERSLTLLQVDMNELQQVNTTHGYEAGSLLLKQFAEICVEQLRKTETIARDDDEFYILLPNTPLENVQPVCQRIIDRFEEISDIPVNIRIGGCTYHPNSDMTLEILLDKLQVQLEFAKDRSVITDSHEIYLDIQKTKTNNVLRLIK